MYFEDARFLYLLLLLPLFFAYEVLAFRRQSRWHRRFCGESLDRRARLRSAIFMATAFAAVAFSLSGPWVPSLQRQLRRSGIQIAFGIDASLSMLAEDAARPDTGDPAPGIRNRPIRNRLEQARQFAAHAIGGLKGEQVGIFIFARNGVEIVPLTEDYGYALYALAHLNNAELASPGSDLSEAIQTGQGMLLSSGAGGARNLVLLSDGEDEEMDGESLREAIRVAKNDDIRIHAVGIGTPAPALIPARTRDPAGIAEYYRDGSGAVLKTRMTEGPLKTIARETGGTYLRASESGAPRQLLLSIEQEAEKTASTRETTTAKEELSPAFMLLSMAFFALRLLCGR